MAIEAKDPTLKAVVERLRRELGVDYFVEVGHWDGDPLAVGLARPDDAGTLVYVAVQPDDPEDMFYECETPSPDGLYDVPDRGDRVGYPEVLAAVRRHLAP